MNSNPNTQLDSSTPSSTQNLNILIHLDLTNSIFNSNSHLLLQLLPSTRSSSETLNFILNNSCLQLDPQLNPQLDPKLNSWTWSSSTHTFNSNCQLYFYLKLWTLSLTHSFNPISIQSLTQTLKSILKSRCQLHLYLKPSTMSSTMFLTMSSTWPSTQTLSSLSPSHKLSLATA